MSKKKEPKNQDRVPDDCLFDKEGRLNKREFLKRLGKIGGLTLTSFAFVGFPGRKASATPPDECIGNEKNDGCEKLKFPIDNVDRCIGPFDFDEGGDSCTPYMNASLRITEAMNDRCETPFFKGSQGGDKCWFFEELDDDIGDVCQPPYTEATGDECKPEICKYSDK